MLDLFSLGNKFIKRNWEFIVGSSKYFIFQIWKMLTIRLKLNFKQSQNVSNFPLCMMRYAEDHVDFIQSFLAYLVCITAWILIKPQKIIVDIFTELLGFICAGELLTAYIQRKKYIHSLHMYPYSKERKKNTF